MVGPTVGRAEVDVHADLSPFRRELQAAAALAGRDYGDTLANSLDRRLKRTTRVFDRFWFSQLRGSRNDFLNFVGIVSSGMERLVGNVLGRGLGLIATGFENLGNVIARFPSLIGFAGGFRLLGEQVRGLGAGGIDGLVIQLIGLTVAFSGVVGASGVLAAGISTLAAGVTALAVGIGGALFGGIVALLPVVSALGAGIGALALGFTKLSDEQKAAFGPLNDLLGELRSGVQEALFSNLGNQVDSLVTALRPLGPFLNSVAAVFRDWVSQIIADIGPGGPLDSTFRSLGQSIPGTLDRLLDVLSRLGGSLLGLFDAATPAADRLLEAIGRVLGRFSEWVNSVQGQEAINTFLQKAIDLLGLLWGIAGEVGTALSNLWTQGGAAAAEDLLTSIRDIVGQFNAWLDTDAGREALLQWFRDGVTAIQELGTFLNTIIILFDSLDTAMTREGFSQFITFLSNAVIWLASIVSTVQFVIQAIIDFGDTAGSVLSRVADFMTNTAQAGMDFRDNIDGAFSAAAVAVSNARASIGNAVTRIQNSLSNLAAQWNRNIQSLINSAIDLRNRAQDAFNRLASSIGGALGRAVASVVNFRNRAVDAFNRFASSIGGAVGRVMNAINRLPGQAGAALGRFVGSIQNGVTRAITALQNFARRAISTITSLPARFASIGVSIMQGLYNGVVSRGGAILDYLRNLASSAASTFASILGISSPSKVFEEFGKDIVEGLVEGLGNGIADVTSATNSLANAALPGNLNTPVSGLANQAADVGGGNSPARSVTDIGGITIVTPYADPRLVALQLMDDLAARGK